MNIGFDAKRLFNNRTGLGNYSRTLVSNLQHFYPSEDYHLFTPDIRDGELSKDITSSPNTHIHTAKSKNKTLWRSFDIKKDISMANIDIFHGLSHELPRRNTKLDCAKVVTIHDLIFKMHPNFFPMIDRTFYNIKCKHSLKTADKVIAISQSTKADIIKYYNVPEEKIEVIYQACSPSFYQPTPSKIDNNLDLPSEYNLCVGSIEPRKNLVSVIKAYAQLPKDLQIPLLIIGDGKAHKTQIIGLINSLNLNDVVSIKSNISNDQITEVYRRANCLIYPSHYEGFGLPVVEALLTDTPVITSDNSSLREAGGEHSIYVDPNSVGSIAQGIQMVMENDSLRQTMRSEGRVYALRTFSPEVVTRQLFGIYEGLL